MSARALLDGLEEARRGLWPSAAESLSAAAAAAPEDPRPALALAVVELHRRRPEAALVALETAPALRDAAPPWAARAAWLVAAARLEADDPLGAQRAVARAPEAIRRRVEATARLRAGDYAAGVRALLLDRIPVRILRPPSSPPR